jgi:hypothetical protein
MGIINAQIRIAGKTIAPGTSGEATYTENVCILPANAYILAKFGRIKTAFAGITKPKVALGVTGDTDRYMVAQPIDAVNEFVMGPPPSSNDSLLGHKHFCVKLNKEKAASTATPIIATFTSDSATFDPTAGEVEFIIVYIDPNEYTAQKLFS